jgi:hypothetical protein
VRWPAGLEWLGGEVSRGNRMVKMGGGPRYQNGCVERCLVVKEWLRWEVARGTRMARWRGVSW